jgi:type I restriction enzyme, S subunit
VAVSTNNIFCSGDILFGKLRPQLRKCVRVELDGYCSTDILVLRAYEQHDSSYAAKILQSDSVFSAAIRMEEGTKMPRTSWQDIKDIRVLCPPYLEQQKIAEILTTIDNLIEKTEALIAKYQTVKQGMMHDLFTRGVDAAGKLRPTFEDAPELYQESAIGWIPKEWEALKLAIVASLQRGHDIREKDLCMGRYPVISSSGIVGFHNVFTSKGPNVLLGEKALLGKCII